MTRPSRKRREIHIGIDVAKDLPDTWRLYAECADEQTEMIFIGKQPFDLPKTEDELISSGFAEMLLLDHQVCCTSCQRWAAGRKTIARLGGVSG